MMDKERFSLLLLDPGEIFFEDFSVLMIDEDVSDSNFESLKQVGRLKMCSKSIVFDPKDIAKPLLKIPLKECTVINELHEMRLSRLLPQENAISVHTKQHVQMLEGNVTAPYKFINKPTKFVFYLNYAKVSDCLPPLCQLHRASSLPVAEQNSMIAAIVFSRQSRVSFDQLWLEDLYEQIVFEVQGSRITPLVSNPGRVLLTSACLYFQPFNNVELYPVLKIQLHNIKKVVKRRFLLRQVGLEIYCAGRSKVEHLFLCLSNPVERDQLFEKILEQPTFNIEETNQEVMTLQWQNGVISNYEYLQYLNSMADRTFNDLTQYPVFPWVLADHSSEDLDFDDPNSYRDLSKPVGALNPVRLKRLKDRYDEMPEPKFLYGSHYSAPGFVLFYLVRKYPHYMLCLQNGRFDHPDRMFNSVPDVWKNVQNNMADFKELIPEFYDESCEGDFCNNFYGIDFGRRHDGSKVGGVELPGWAKDSKDFVKKMRGALENDWTSKNLHHWIDLIFGYKQTGQEAVKADNVFYHLCYEGAVDLDSIKDPNQRHALEVQIMEFGQIPKQVFTLPHPCKLVNSPQHCLGNFAVKFDSKEGNTVTCKETVFNVGKCRQEWPQGLTKRLNITLQSHREEVACVALSSTQNEGGGDEKAPLRWHVFSVGHDSLLKIHEISSGHQVRSASLSSMPLSACVPLSISNLSRADSTLVIVASWDNTVSVYDVEYGRVVEQATLHDDALSCLIWIEGEEEHDGILASGSWDCSVRLWRLLAPENSRPPPVVSSLGNSHRLLLSHPARSFLDQLNHEGRLMCLDYSRKARILVSGTEDGEIYLWCLKRLNTLKEKLKGHSPGSVTAVKVSPDGFRLASCGSDSFIRVFDLKTSMEVYSKAMEEPLRSLAWNGSYLILGGCQGSLFVWDMVRVELLQQIEAHCGAVTSVAVSNDGLIVVTGGEDKKVNVWEPVF